MRSARAGGLAVGAALLCGLLLAPVAAPPAGAQEITEARSARRDLGRAERLRVDVEYAAGRVSVSRADPGFLYQSYLRYDASRFDPSRQFSLDGGEARLEFGMEGVRSGGRWIRWDGLDIDIDLGGLRNLNESSSALELGLSRTVPTELSLEIGAAETDLRLGGIPLTSLSMETGASETGISFDRPNPTRMERLELEAGAASLRTRGLGNARFSELRLQGGVGDVRLDFTGEWTRDASARVEVGLGSLRLIFPEELGVRIRRESFLSSFDAPAGFRRTDAGYVSENWDSAEHRLTMDLSAALGSVRISVRD